MRRNVLVTLVPVGALCLGVLAILRGQAGLGACFIGLGVLRGLMLFQSRKSRKPDPSVRLNLTEDEVRPPKNGDEELSQLWEDRQ